MVLLISINSSIGFSIEYYFALSVADVSGYCDEYPPHKSTRVSDLRNMYNNFVYRESPDQ